MEQRTDSRSYLGSGPCTFPIVHAGVPCSTAALSLTAVLPRSHQIPGPSRHSKERGWWLEGRIQCGSQQPELAEASRQSFCQPLARPHHPHPLPSPELKGSIVGPRAGWGGAAWRCQAVPCGTVTLQEHSSLHQITSVSNTSTWACVTPAGWSVRRTQSERNGGTTPCISPHPAGPSDQ